MTTPSRAPAIEELYLPRDVRAFTCDVTPELIAQLRAEEREALAPMAVKRQAEFATARACARAAMNDLGVDAAIPRRDGGAPQWPADLAGSISHTRGFCVSVSSRESIALGIDVELVARMSAAVEKRILGEEEVKRLSQVEGDDRRELVATIFAAKEAFYKAHYEVDPRYIGFDAVSIEVGDGGTVRFGPDAGVVDEQLLHKTSGRALMDAGRVIVGVTIDTAEMAIPLPSAT